MVRWQFTLLTSRMDLRVRGLTTWTAGHKSMCIARSKYRGSKYLNHFHNFFKDMFLSVSFFITFATAISKSSCVTCTRRSRRANIPASVQTACHKTLVINKCKDVCLLGTGIGAWFWLQAEHEGVGSESTLSSAPDAPPIFSAIFFRSIPRIKFIFLEWILRMSSRDCIPCSSCILAYNLTAKTNNIKFGLSEYKVAPSYLFCRIGELNFSVNSARTQKSLIENINSIRCHQYLQVRKLGVCLIDRNSKAIVNNKSVALSSKWIKRTRPNLDLVRSFKTIKLIQKL